MELVGVSGGDAADASWEVGRIRSMGLHPVVRETEEDYYAISLPKDEAAAFEGAGRDEERTYWRSSEGIEDMKWWGRQNREFLRSPEGRLQKCYERSFQGCSNH